MVEILLRCPNFFLNLSTDANQKLQKIQNAAMRIATGCHLRASSDHLHAETQLLPVVKSLEMVCAQYLASALRPTHPSHTIVTQPSGPRNQRDTLQSKFLPKISAFLTNNITPIDEYEQIYKEIHTEAVQEAIRTQPPNPIIQIQPPTVDPVEKNPSQSPQNSPLTASFRVLQSPEQLPKLARSIHKSSLPRMRQWGTTHHQSPLPLPRPSYGARRPGPVAET